MSPHLDSEVQTKKEKLLTKEVADMFNIFSHEDVIFLTDKNGEWYLGERKMDQSLMRQYAEEAQIIQKMMLWKEIDKSIKYHTNRLMFLRSRDFGDMIAGKLVLLTLKNIQSILEMVKNLKTNPQIKLAKK